MGEEADADWERGMIELGYDGPRKDEKPHVHHMLDQLTAERDNLRNQLSAVAKALAWEPPYQASLAERAKHLMDERDALRAERDRLSDYLRQKDEAMGVLFDRLAKAGVDCSDLIS